MGTWREGVWTLHQQGIVDTNWQWNSMEHKRKQSCGRWVNLAVLSDFKFRSPNPNLSSIEAWFSDLTAYFETMKKIFGWLVREDDWINQGRLCDYGCKNATWIFKSLSINFKQWFLIWRRVINPVWKSDKSYEHFLHKNEHMF